jgi:arginase
VAANDEGSRPCTILDAPSDLGLRPTGVRRLPGALRAAGILEGMREARHAGRVPVSPYVARRDESTGILNPEGIRTFTLDLAERLAFTLDLGHFPVVLGGDCSILLGSMLALRRRGRFGLFFLDGHADFYSPASEPNGEVVSMELSLVSGRGPALLSDLEGRRPLVRSLVVWTHGRYTRWLGGERYRLLLLPSLDLLAQPLYNLRNSHHARALHKDNTVDQEGRVP